jgi:hypothetical protein
MIPSTISASVNQLVSPLANNLNSLSMKLPFRVLVCHHLITFPLHHVVAPPILVNVSVQLIMSWMSYLLDAQH